MKLPNFRLYETQATFSMLLGLAGGICAAMLAVCVFRGFDTAEFAVTYDPDGRFGRFRRPLVYGLTVITVLAGVVAVWVGFRSLGERRNTRQSHSWLGMMLGALVVAAAPVLCFAWRQFGQPLIKNIGL
jgi:hypothetical protein